MKASRWSGGIAPLILNLDTRRRWEVNFAPHRLTAPPPNWIWGWVGPTASLDIWRRKGSFVPEGIRHLDRPFLKQVSSWQYSGFNYRSCFVFWICLVRILTGIRFILIVTFRVSTQSLRTTANSSQVLPISPFFRILTFIVRCYKATNLK